MSGEAFHEVRELMNGKGNLVLRGRGVNKEMGGVNRKIAAGTVEVTAEAGR